MPAEAPQRCLNDVVDFALSLYGIPYEWGGSGPTKARVGYGYDCSGFVQAVLKFAGVFLPYDMSAENLRQYFKGNGVPVDPRVAALAFFGTDEKATHVGFMLSNKIMISAAGGGAHVTTPIIAKWRDAYIKIQPISWYRAPAFMGCLMPFYEFTSW